MVGHKVLFSFFFFSFSVHFLHSKNVASCAFLAISIALSQANTDTIVLLILELHTYRIGFMPFFGSGTMFLVMASNSPHFGGHASRLFFNRGMVEATYMFTRSLFGRYPRG